MKKYLLSAFLLISTANASAPSLNLIDEILAQQWPEGQPRPHVTFDIDDTLAEKNRDAYENQRAILERFPDSLVVPWKHESTLYKHVFYPEVMEVFLTLLQRGWNIDFFSSAVEDRNQTVIPAYFKYMLAKYTHKPEEALEALMAGRIRIFSRGDMVDNDIRWQTLDKRPA